MIDSGINEAHETPVSSYLQDGNPAGRGVNMWEKKPETLKQ